MNGYLTGNFLAQIRQFSGHSLDEFQHGIADLSDKDAFIGQTEPSRPATAQLDIKLSFEAFERQADGRLLTAKRSACAANASRLNDLVKSLQKIPIEVSRKCRHVFACERFLQLWLVCCASNTGL